MPRKVLEQGAHRRRGARSRRQIREILLVADRADEWTAVATQSAAMRCVGHAEGANSRGRQLLGSLAGSPTSRTCCGRSATRFARTARSTITPRRRWRTSAARSKSSAGTIQRIVATGICANLSEGGHAAGRTGHYSRRALRDSRKSGAEAARAGRGARHEFQRTDCLRRAAGDDRAEQRTGSPSRRRARAKSIASCWR